MRPPRTAISARRQGFPLPSITRPFLISTSKGPASCDVSETVKISVKTAAANRPSLMATFLLKQARDAEPFEAAANVAPPAARAARREASLAANPYPCGQPGATARPGGLGQNCRPALRERRNDARPEARRIVESRSVRRSIRPHRVRSRRAAANPLARDSARVDRRLDLPESARPSPGDRPRRARPQAVPLPPALARGARRSEVRPPDRVREALPRHPRGARTTICARAGCRARRCSRRSCSCSRRR